MSVDYASEWIEKAEEDYWAAVSLLCQIEHPVPNVVCFHCQQCAEKYLKAFLASHDVDIPKIHSLVTLSDMCSVLYAQFGLIAPQLEQLEVYAVEFRYPGESATQEEAGEAMKAMKQVWEFVQAGLSIRLR